LPLKDALAAALAQLTSAHVPSPRLNAETLLMFTLGCGRAYLYAHPERQLTSDEQRRYDDVLAQRTKGVPAQYITGHQEFWGLDLIVSPAVLIPRPETEHLIETVLPLARAFNRPQIVDVGTGSGAIAIALAKELPAAEITGTDISEAALKVASVNAVRHQAENRILFRLTDLLAGIEASFVDIVASNPPYVGESEEDEVQLEVRKFEPRHAVFAGHTGAEVIERLIPQAHRVLKPGGWLLMEISGTIAARVRDLLSNWSEVRTVKDLQGIERVAVARKL